MSSNIAPLVTILTPVFNGARYFEECIESIIKQKYKNWEYIIVNNCSTDSTKDIAIHYSEIIPRIRIHNNIKFLGIIENHNNAFGLISPESKYCKVVSADDTISPFCVEKMVALAEAHPRIAIVGAYQRSGKNIIRKGIPVGIEVMPGREICRKTLLEELHVFGPPTSVLYRSDLIRKSKSFFSHNLPYADLSVFYEVLQDYDFGFIHEVLSDTRIHDEQESAVLNNRYIGKVANLDVFLKYGPRYLNGFEYKKRENEILLDYNYWLGGCIWNLYGLDFWRYHINRSKELGHPIQWGKLPIGSLLRIKNEMRDPKNAINKLMQAITNRKSSRL